MASDAQKRDEQKRWAAREAIENGVFMALEAGMTKDEIKAECLYALENAED